MLSHSYNIIISRSVGAPGHMREVVGGLDATSKRVLSILMENLQLSSSKGYDTHMSMNTAIKKRLKFSNGISKNTCLNHHVFFCCLSE